MPAPPQRTSVVLLLAVFAAGCAEWPRFANITAVDGTPSSVDPRTLFEIEWTEVDETDEEANDSPVTAPSLTLDTPDSGDRAYLVTAELAGIGWSDNADDVLVENPDCAGAGTAPRSPPGGEYLYDVDFVVLEIEESGTLCARVQQAEEDVGWDLLLYPIDACNIPGDAVEVTTEAGTEVLGFGGGGTVGGWATTVGAGSRYAVLFAGFAPNDTPDALTALPYVAGFTWVPSESDGSAGLCPLLPGEEADE